MAATIVAAAVLTLALCGSSKAQNNSILAVDPLQAPLPFYFPPIGSANTPGLFPMPACRGITLEEATIDQLQGYMRDGLLTSAQLLRCYLRRVWQVDEYINSIIELNPDAEEIADALDAERRAGRVRGRLHGIPFIVKDNIASKDQMETTAGSWALLGSVVPRDAHVVARLRQAGALRTQGPGTMCGFCPKVRSSMNRYSGSIPRMSRNLRQDAHVPFPAH
jgi:amidase